MYIILSGTIAIIKKSEEFGNLEVQINSLYQGETFGEMALIGELNKEESLRRSASCVSDNNTLVIGVPKQDYIHILLEMMQNDIHGKAMFFSQLIIFQGVDQYSLIPLAANIEPNTYKINQIILNAGEQPQGLYIIYKGNCKVI